MTVNAKLNGYGRPATEEERIRLEKFAVDYALLMKNDAAAKAGQLRDLAAQRLAVAAGGCSQGPNVKAEDGKGPFTERVARAARKL